jgi:hypothetical protein
VLWMNTNRLVIEVFSKMSSCLRTDTSIQLHVKMSKNLGFSLNVSLVYVTVKSHVANENEAPYTR